MDRRGFAAQFLPGRIARIFGFSAVRDHGFGVNPGSARVPPSGGYLAAAGASRRKTLFGETPNDTREDAYAPQILRRRQPFGNFL